MFDPLHKWLGIPPSEQPPNDYRLLGLSNYEDDPEVIDSAADRDLTFLHNLTNGEHGDLAEELSNRISATRLRLLNKEKKAAYDAELRAQEGEDEIDIDSVIESLGPHEAPGSQEAPAQPNNSSAPATPGKALDVLGMPPGVGATVATPADPPNENVPPPAPPTTTTAATTATAAKRAPQVQSGGGRKSARRKRFSLIWLLGVLPASCVLGYLLFSIWTGRLHLDPNKLERLGVPPEQAAQFAGESSESPDQTGTTIASIDGTGQPLPTTPQPQQRTGNRPGSTPNANTATSPTPSPRTSPSPTAPSNSTPNNNSPNTPGNGTTTSPTPDSDSPSLAEFLRTSGKQKIPSTESITQKLQTVRDLYQQDFLAAKTREQKIAVADQIRETAMETQNDPDGQFALFRVARDIFILEKDFTSAIEIVDLLNQSFEEVDVIRLKREILASIETPGTGTVEYTGAAIGLADECIQSGRLDDGIEVCKTLRETVKRLPQSHAARFKDIEERLTEAKTLLDRYQQVAATLETNPNDADAQTAAGKYLCLVANQWDDGLPRLAAGSDPLYRQAAETELAMNGGGATELQVADNWFKIFDQSESNFEKRSIADHSKAYYQSARLKTAGLESRKIDQRLLTLNESATPGPLSNSRLRAQQRAAAAESRSDTKNRARTAQPKVIQTRTFDSSSPNDFANIRGNSIQIGMGNQSSGTGEAAAGVEFENVGTIGIQGAASHPTMTTASSVSKVGFFIDYHTPAGYSKRVFLNCATNTPSYFFPSPPWGTAKAPDARDFLPVSPQYTIDLEKWAPNDWDGRCWFSVYMQNAGLNRMLTARLSWKARTSTLDAE